MHGRVQSQSLTRALIKVREILKAVFDVSTAKQTDDHTKIKGIMKSPRRWACTNLLAIRIDLHGVCLQYLS